MTSDCNFSYIKCYDLDEILHGGSAWCEVPPVEILSKSVNFKGGNDIIFCQLYKKKNVFLKFRYLKFFTHSKFFTWNLIRVYYMCMQNFRTIYQLFFRLQVEKGLKSAIFREFWSSGLQKIVIWHPKTALRVMKFLGGITNSPLKKF